MQLITILDLLEKYCLFDCVNPVCTNTYCSVNKIIRALNEKIEKEAQKEDLNE